MNKIFLLVMAFFLFIGNQTFAQHYEQQHRGMSKQGKGALIGGGVGVVAGTLIGHNVTGALIGGAIGAGGGYIIGNEQHRREVKRRREFYRQNHYYPDRYKYKYRRGHWYKYK